MRRESQVDTAQALYERARDQHRAGTSPAIDELRSQVELKTQQQQLLALQNQVAKDKLTLARAIGLPSGQVFEITDKAPYKPLEGLAPADALQTRLRLARRLSERASAGAGRGTRSPAPSRDEWQPTASISYELRRGRPDLRQFARHFRRHRLDQVQYFRRRKATRRHAGSRHRPSNSGARNWRICRARSIRKCARLCSI